MSKRFDGKVVLVTGSTSGMGRTTAERFAKEGAKVVISGRREDDGLTVVASIENVGGSASFFRADVSKEEDVKALVASTVAKYGQIDVLFNNAGVEGKNGPITTLEASDWDFTFGVNVRGTWLVTKHAFPWLAKTKGVIINNSSVAASKGMLGTSIYGASKAAIEAFTRATAIEFAHAGVRVNAVSPGPIATDMGTRFFGSQEALNGFGNTMPAGRPGATDDIADVVLFLASNESSYILGQVIQVDGGFTAK
jgi:NAD(P)-dependent dehydrogenase (short-subunit alcohol dehydrogenase family)